MQAVVWLVIIFLSVSNPIQFGLWQTSQEVVVEVPAQIELSVGETYTIELPGLGTAGYLWTHEVIADSELINVSVTTARTQQSGNEGSPASVGSSVNQIFILKAQRVGRASIRFVQRRAWEQNQPPLKEHILEIDIHD